MPNNKSDIINSSDEKAHSWRVCPVGKHFVQEHIVHIPPSRAHPAGKTTICHEHCADNPSHKDELSYYEIQYITKTYFSDLSGLPTPGRLIETFPLADRYDAQIRGWVKYWNDIFQPQEPLDADLIKALIGSESSFRENPTEISTAHGLMQIRNDTFLILQDTKGELKDYLVRIPRNKLIDPSANICVGVRWLFQKKKLASIRLKREASWDEAVIEYKSYWKEIEKGHIPTGMDNFRKYLNILKGE